MPCVWLVAPKRRCKNTSFYENRVIILPKKVINIPPATMTLSRCVPYFVSVFFLRSVALLLSYAISSLRGADVCMNWAAARHSANELARFAEAPPSLCNRAQDKYQRLMNTNASKRAQCQFFLNIAEREH